MRAEDPPISGRPHGRGEKVLSAECWVLGSELEADKKGAM